MAGSRVLYICMDNSPSSADVDVTSLDRAIYRPLIRDIKYGIVFTRSGFLFDTDSFLQSVYHPTQFIWRNAELVSWYVNFTSSAGIKFKEDLCWKASQFSSLDANFSGCSVICRSIGAGVVSVSEEVIGWRLRMQTLTADSTVKVKYVASSPATQDALCVSSLFKVGLQRCSNDVVSNIWNSQAAPDWAKTSSNSF